RRDADDIAASFEDRASARRRDRGVRDARSDLLVFRAQREHIAIDRDVDRLGLARLQIVDAERSELLVNDPVRAGRGRLDVETVILNQLRDFLRLRVVAEQSDWAAAVE